MIEKNKIEVSYTIEGTPHTYQFDTEEEAEAFVMMLLTSYGDEYINSLTMVKVK